MLRAERILCPLSRSGGGDGGLRLLRRRGGGGSAKEELLRRPLGRSDSGDDNNSINVPLHSLQRDSDDGGPPGPLRSSDNTPALTDSY